MGLWQVIGHVCIKVLGIMDGIYEPWSVFPPPSPSCAALPCFCAFCIISPFLGCAFITHLPTSSPHSFFPPLIFPLQLGVFYLIKMSDRNTAGLRFSNSPQRNKAMCATPSVLALNASVPERCGCGTRVSNRPAACSNRTVSARAGTQDPHS